MSLRTKRKAKIKRNKEIENKLYDDCKVNWFTDALPLYLLLPFLYIVIGVLWIHEKLTKE